MKKSNIFVSIIIILIGIFTLIEVKSFPQGQNNVVGPGFFPGIIASNNKFSLRPSPFALLNY